LRDQRSGTAGITCQSRRAASTPLAWSCCKHAFGVMARIAHGLLNLSAAIGLEPVAHQWLAPPCGRIAKPGLKDRVAGHRWDARIDIAPFAHAAAINRQLRPARPRTDGGQA
jgi:hypothetical protein